MMVNSGLTFRKQNHCMIVQIKESNTDYSSWLEGLAYDIEDLSAEINWDEDTWVVVLVYSGQFFQKTAEEKNSLMVEEHLASIVSSVGNIRKPVIAAIEGDALGYGLELALACDIRIGTEGAYFGLPQITEGKIPSAGGTQRLPRLVGYSQALNLILTGEAVDTTEAVRLGLVHRVVPVSKLLDTCSALGVEMASRSPLSMNFVKEALNGALDLTIEHGMRMELDLYLLLFTTQDRIEGITAFKEKRVPQFKGV